MSELIFYDMKQVSGLAPSLASQTAREIGRRVVAGSYPVGSLLEDENSLATRYQVSRSVIRDAIKMLSGKGLLEVRRGIGTRVRERASWGLLDDDVLAWSQSAPFHESQFRQLMEVRQIFEPKAARWAAERADDDSIAKIRRAVDRMEAEKGSVVDFITADAQFHRAVLHAAQNEFLIAMEGIIFSALLNSIRVTNKDPRDNEDSILFHRSVCLAIEDRDGDLSEMLMNRLLQDARERLVERAGSA